MFLEQTERVRAFLFGHDIFISYARADALDYAPRLANQLTKLGFRCYLDQLDAPPGVKTPEAVLTALRRSTSLVIVGTNRAAESVAVGDEVNFFSKLSRVILPIDVNMALEKAVWGETIAGMARTRESALAVEKGRPSRQVINRIYDSAQFRRRNNQLKHTAFAVLAVIAVLILAGAGLSIFFSRMARAARDEQGKAESTRQQAVRDAEAAQALKSQAEHGLVEAQTKLKTAASQLVVANEQTATAQAATKSAQAATKNAELKRAQSEQRVRKQQVIAASLDLANNSTRKLGQGLVEESMMDATASTQRLLTVNERAVESDRTLRRSLAVLPKALAPPRITELDGGFRDVSFSPDAQHFIILNSDGSVAIYNRESNSAPRQVASATGSPSRELLYGAFVALSNNLKRWALKKPGDTWVEVKDLESRQEWKIDLGRSRFDDLALSADGRYLVVVTDDDAQLWSVEERKLLAWLLATDSRLSLAAAAFSPDGKTVGVGGEIRFGGNYGFEQGRIFIWYGFDGYQGTQWQQKDFDSNRQELPLSDDNVSCLALNNGANSFATCSGKVWGLTPNGRLEPAVYLPARSFTQAVAFDTTGQSVSSVGLRPKKENTAGIWVSGWYGKDIAGWSYDVWSSSGYSAITSITYSGHLAAFRFDRADNSISVVGRPERSEQGLVRYWNTTNWVEQEEKRLGGGDPIEDIEIKNMVGGRFFASARVVKLPQPGADEFERRIHVDVWDLVKRSKTSVTPEGACLSKDELLLSADGNTLVLGCFRKSPAPDLAAIYRRQSDKLLKFHDIELKDGEELNSLSSDGKFLIVHKRSGKHQPRLISVIAGKEVDQGIFSEGMVGKTIFSPNSKVVAVMYLKESSEIGVAARVEVSRLSDGRRLAKVDGGAGLMLGFDFSPDGRYLATVASDGRLTIVDLYGNKSVATEFNFLDGPMGLFFDERSRLLAVPTDGAIRVIDLATTREIAEIPVEESLGNVAFSYDGKYLAGEVLLTRTKGTLLRVWHLSPHALLKEATARFARSRRNDFDLRETTRGKYSR